MNELMWLQNWFAVQCDGVWEHAHGIKIDTLDNPGWTVQVDLEGIQSPPREVQEFKEDDGDDNWMHCVLSAKEFRGRGGPSQLEEILKTFRLWMEPQS